MIEMKIGQKIQAYAPDLISKCDDDPLLFEKFLNKQYCRNKLGLKYPLFEYTENIETNRDRRYYKKLYEFDGKSVRLCNHWYDAQSEMLSLFLMEIGIANELRHSDFTVNINTNEKNNENGKNNTLGSIGKSNVSINKNDDRSIHSRICENIVDHIFMGALLQRLWQRNAREIEVLRAEVDAFGYDVVVSVGGIVRNIQLKTKSYGSETVRVNIDSRLMTNVSGCVVLLEITSDLDIHSYRWFGAEPGQEPIDISQLKVAKTTRGNKDGKKIERKNQRVLPISKIIKMNSLDELIDKLFGKIFAR